MVEQETQNYSSEIQRYPKANMFQKKRYKNAEIKDLDSNPTGQGMFSYSLEHVGVLQDNKVPV